MFDFTEPSHSGRSTGRAGPWTAWSACASIGSPSLVPVPWASIASIWSARSAASARAARMTCCWDGPLGAVSPLLAPSWFTAVPLISASTGWPWRRASLWRSSSSTPAPSPQPVPSASAEKALHRPSAASPR